MSDITRDDLKVLEGRVDPIYDLSRPVADEELDRLVLERIREIPGKALRALLTDECDCIDGSLLIDVCGCGNPDHESHYEEREHADCGVRGWLPKDGTVLDWRCFVAELNPEHPIKDANADGTPERCRYSGGHSSKCGWRLLVEVDWLEAEDD